jgi:hypothetical protein
LSLPILSPFVILAVVVDHYIPMNDSIAARIISLDILSRVEDKKLDRPDVLRRLLPPHKKLLVVVLLLLPVVAESVVVDGMMGIWRANSFKYGSSSRSASTFIIDSIPS